MTLPSLFTTHFSTIDKQVSLFLYFPPYRKRALISDAWERTYFSFR